MNRGARREAVFSPTDHSGLFLTLLGETVERFSIEVHAYAVMPNHFHLLLRSARGNLSAAMGHLSGRFTRHINRNNQWDGPVFRGRFKNQVMKTTSHLLTVAAYIHLNPVRARLVRRMDANCWTSHRSYLGLDVPPEWLRRDLLLEEVGGVESFAEMVTGFRKHRRPWPEGFDTDFAWFEDAEPPPKHRRPAVSDGPPTSPGDTVKNVLQRVCGLTAVRQSSLRGAKPGRRGNAARRFAAWALARETTLTYPAIGQALGMTAGQVAVTLTRMRQSKAPTIHEWMDKWVNPGER